MDLRLSNSDRVMLLDDEDARLIGNRSVWAHRSSGNVTYAFTSIGGRNVPIHRLIMQPETGFEVDHANGDGLDNRRANLRVCPRRLNAANRGPNKANTSGFKGVCFDRSRGKYLAGLNVNYRRINLGRFDTAEEAARAYDAAATKAWGEFAHLNFAEARP